MIATERFEDFAANLQKEIEQETGIRFGIVEKHQFAAIPIVKPDGSVGMLGMAESQAIFDYLGAQGLVDDKGRVKDTLRTAIKDGTLTLPPALTPHLQAVRDVLRKVAGSLNIKNSADRVTIRARQAVLDGPDFKALWDRIKHKTTYRVEFDNEKLIADCIKAIANGPPVSRARVRIRKADILIGKGGVEAHEQTSNSATILTIEEGDIVLPDVLTDLQDRTQLTRKSLVRILTECGRLTDFKRNPQSFIEMAGEVINRTKRLALVNGVKYQRIGDESYYAQELFQQKELIGYLRNTLADEGKGVSR